MRLGIFNANIGIGDLLVYAMFTIAALKAYGPKAARLALACVAVFGAVAPSLTPLFVHAVIRGTVNVVVPAQTLFGPPAFLLWLWLARRYGRERTVAEFLASDDVVAPVPARTAAERRPAPSPSRPGRVRVAPGTDRMTT
jgi:hypothetical protein